MKKTGGLSKLITIFCFVIPILELYNNLFYTSHNYDVILVKYLLDPLRLDWVLGRDLYFSTNGLNYINAIFEGLLLLGGILYVATKTAETRLIRMVASIVFLSNILSFVYSIAFFSFIRSPRLLTTKDLAYDAFYYLFQLLWIYLSYKAIVYFKASRELKTDIYEHGETSVAIFTEASLWQRFLHPVIDTVITIMLFSPLITLFIVHNGRAGFFGGLNSNSIPQSLLLMLILFCRIAYYLFFEGIFGYTPAKLFTETRVIDEEGTKPYFVNIVGRTFLRLVPFEAVTFFTGRGLHDKASKTTVAKEKQKGV